MGQVHTQGVRSEMIDSLKKTGGEYYCNVNSAWQSEDSLTTQDYRKILEQSIFVPCPRGNNNVDTFRLYEAIEAGSIPIVVKDKYWENLFGAQNLLIQIDSWDNVSGFMANLLQEKEWLSDYPKKLSFWWKDHKNTLSNKIKNIISERSHEETIVKKEDISCANDKVKEFINLKDQWANFKDYKFLNYISELIPKEDSPKEEYTMYNPGKKIAIVSLYTQEISDYAIHSENSIKEYCKKQNYTFYVYRRKIDEDSSPNWSKAQALLNHVNDHDYLIWMDSDTLVFNPEKKFEDIISKASRKFIIATKDIGENSMLNSGVLIFKCHNYTKNLIKKWRDFDGDKSSLYASGGDQEILCEILRKSDGFGFNRKIFEMNEFNTDPRFVDKDTFILHFMAYPHKLKKIFMSYWQNNFSTESL